MDWQQSIIDLKQHNQLKEIVDEVERECLRDECYSLKVIYQLSLEKINEKLANLEENVAELEIEVNDLKLKAHIKSLLK